VAQIQVGVPEVDPVPCSERERRSSKVPLASFPQGLDVQLGNVLFEFVLFFFCSWAIFSSMQPGRNGWIGTTGSTVIRALNGNSPAEHYTRSQRRPTTEGLDLLLIHEEPRKVTRTGHISYYGQFYRVPDAYIGRGVWTVLKGETLRIESGKDLIARYQVKTDYFKD